MAHAQPAAAAALPSRCLQCLARPAQAAWTPEAAGETTEARIGRQAARLSASLAVQVAASPLLAAPAPPSLAGPRPAWLARAAQLRAIWFRARAPAPSRTRPSR